MSTVRERIAYVRGLIQGAEMAGTGTVTKDVLEKMLDIFDALAHEVEELEVGRIEVEEYLEAIDADLGDLEDEMLGIEFEDDEDDDNEGQFIEIQCPNCRATMYFDDGVLFGAGDDDDLDCPECGEPIYRADTTDQDDDESSLL